jgi:pilus assembly protein FimV
VIGRHGGGSREEPADRFGGRLETTLDERRALCADRGGAGRRMPGRFAGVGAGAGSAERAIGAGRGLRAEIDVTSLTPEEASSLRCAWPRPRPTARPASNTTRRWPGAQVTLQRRPTAGRCCASQRPRAARALHRRDRRSHLGHRPPGARIHAAARPADAPGAAPTASAAARPCHGGPAPAAPQPTGAGARPRRPRPRRRRLRRPAGGRGPRGRRSAATNTGARRRLRLSRIASARIAQRAARRVARPDAGVAVPRQPAGLCRRQHEPAEGRCRADGARADEAARSRQARRAR